MVRNGAPLPALALDPSWQVQAQLLVVVSAVLEQTPAGTAAAEDAYAIIFTALTPLATQSIKVWARPPAVLGTVWGAVLVAASSVRNAGRCLRWAWRE